MKAFLQLIFLLLVVFPALISGNTDDEQDEKGAINENEEDLESSEETVSAPELRASNWRPKGKFVIHTRKNPEGFPFFFRNKSHHVKSRRPTKIITHGYFDGKERIQEIVKEYLNSKEEINVLTYSWNFGSGLQYHLAAKLSEYLGRKIGAHLFGAAGRVQRHKIGRITGLDPARLCFEVFHKNVKLTPLSKHDGRFVDIVHTNAKGEGVFEPYGTADFYPNGGIIQPKCRNHPNPKICSSIFSYDYFRESISNPGNFLARKCRNFEYFLNKKCEGNSVVVFGEFANSTACGSHYFLTKGTKPYGRGMNGTHFD